MSFFESMLALLAVAIVLLQVSRRVAIPYPAMLAAAGVALALVPGAPQIQLDPHTVLALFIAPVLVDAAFDFPIGALRLYWRPLTALALVAVLLSAAAVAAMGVAWAGLPLYAALALGAIVAPPDAAAATAILSRVSMPRRTVTVLKGESLLNDASALLLFSAALAVHQRGAIDTGLGLHIALAVPGGVLLGVLLAWFFRWLTPHVTGTLGGNLSEFTGTLGAWVIADRLGLSAILCLVAFAMTIARSAALDTPPRSRIHSFAVWDSAVFLLNVLAFVLMGLQARTIVASMPADRLAQAGGFAAAVVACLIVVRMAWVLVYNRLAVRFQILRGELRPASLAQGVLVGWCGMRGLVTLATAFALPADFPQRDLIVLTAFATVIATLVLQGLTLGPLVKLLKLDGVTDLPDELARARAAMATAALNECAGTGGPAADAWRYIFVTRRETAQPGAPCAPLDEWRALGRRAMHRQREALESLRNAQTIGPDAFLILQEELDFAEVALESDSERHIEEN
ncbi:sodium:proton antiporter [Caulobacter sp. 17J80-11]|uniref:cation:proton antiporter n=1 Tax=Caulobacter sp. 17J80-11 TaxID=2763502 RepID=UPI001653BA41|nr:cation:proton antiporter [Caulobacter sp. 17J80-11]MBC6982065.1 cation:proton antiporter [Caulobacter sp. 17J80-11]